MDTTYPQEQFARSKYFTCVSNETATNFCLTKQNFNFTFRILCASAPFGHLALVDIFWILPQHCPWLNHWPKICAATVSVIVFRTLRSQDRAPRGKISSKCTISSTITWNKAFVFVACTKLVKTCRLTCRKTFHGDDREGLETILFLNLCFRDSPGRSCVTWQFVILGNMLSTFFMSHHGIPSVNQLQRGDALTFGSRPCSLTSFYFLFLRCGCYELAIMFQERYTYHTPQR